MTSRIFLCCKIGLDYNYIHLSYIKHNIFCPSVLCVPGLGETPSVFWNSLDWRHLAKDNTTQKRIPIQILVRNKKKTLDQSPLPELKAGSHENRTFWYHQNLTIVTKIYTPVYWMYSHIWYWNLNLILSTSITDCESNDPRLPPLHWNTITKIFFCCFSVPFIPVYIFLIEL